MQKQSYWSLFNRPDTLFGICEGVGQDLGVSPNLLRVTLAVAMIWNPVAVLATYALLGVGVVVSRWIAPKPVAASPVAVVAQAGEDGAHEIEYAQAA
ncbi:MAG TPA: PspC domain-containing protein [Sphingomonas sp.]|nr:PspC domain-containing protein [Sphingomonas sp.]